MVRKTVTTLKPSQVTGKQSAAVLSTASGMRWFEQFDPEDQASAIMLVDALYLVSATTFETWIKTQIEKFLSFPDARPCGISVVRSLQGTSTIEQLDSVTAGSEHRISHTIRRLCEAFPDCTYNPSQEQARELRNIIFVDDIVGSGTSTALYLAGFHNDRALASRYSLKRLRYTIMAYAASPFGLRNFVNLLKRSKSKQLISDEPNTIFERDDCVFLGHLNNQILSLCKKYKRRLSDEGKDKLLGFKRKRGDIERLGASRTVFEHGCPNNLPSILWDSGPHWNGLFPSRHVPSDIAIKFDNTISPLLPSISPDQLSIGKEHRFALLVRLAILDNLTVRVRDLGQLAKRAKLPMSTCAVEVDNCRKLGLIQLNELALSEQGRQQRGILRRASKRLLVSPYQESLPSKFFFRTPRRTSDF